MIRPRPSRGLQRPAAVPQEEGTMAAVQRPRSGTARVPDPLLILILAAGVFTTGLNITALGPLIRPIGADLGISDAAVGQLSALHALVAGTAALLVAPW